SSSFSEISAPQFLASTPQVLCTPRDQTPRDIQPMCAWQPRPCMESAWADSADAYDAAVHASGPLVILIAHCCSVGGEAPEWPSLHSGP
ncbi:unnamed protein product, partial [Polarella glacialis]